MNMWTYTDILSEMKWIFRICLNISEYYKKDYGWILCFMTKFEKLYKVTKIHR